MEGYRSGVVGGGVVGEGGVEAEGDAGDVFGGFQWGVGLHERAGADVAVDPGEWVGVEVAGAAGGGEGVVDGGDGGAFGDQVGGLVVGADPSAERPAAGLGSAPDIVLPALPQCRDSARLDTERRSSITAPESPATA